MTKPGQPWFIRHELPVEIRKVHLLGIAGSGVGTFAMMLKDGGYEVRGSDENVYPPMSERLTDYGIKWSAQWNPAHLDWKPDLVVVGNVCRRTNLEAVAASERGIPFVSFPQALSDLFLAHAQPAVLTGTHGKTTTTALVTFLLDAAGLQPGFLLGGVAKNFRAGYRLCVKPDAPFVVEGDEYDTAFFDKGPKFLHYRPKIAVINNIEFDHADIYDDINEIIENFDRLVDIMGPETCLIANGDDPIVQACASKTQGDLIWFGLGANADVRAEEINENKAGVRFRLFEKDQEIGVVQSPMSGRHNVSNVLAAFAVCRQYGVSYADLMASLPNFLGTDKRQDEKGTFDGVLIVDDFAHHPTAIRETLSGLKKKYAGRRVWAIYEPKSNTARRSIHQTAYAEAFLAADHVVIATPFQKDDGLTAQDMLDVNVLTKALTDADTPAYSPGNADAICKFLLSEVVAEDVVVIMANSGFGGLVGKLSQGLTLRESTR